MYIGSRKLSIFKNQSRVRVGRASQKFLEIAFLKIFGMCEGRIKVFLSFCLSHAAENIVGTLQCSKKCS